MERTRGRGDAVALRQITESHRLPARLFRRREIYDVLFSDGTRRLASRGDVDSWFDARRFPADFWATIDAAAASFREGDPRFIRFATGERFEADPD